MYDLLNTLPMEPFGVLAWDVLDREDEIYDSDNVKDEYKVMHALWARWIILNRYEDQSPVIGTRNLMVK